MQEHILTITRKFLTHAVRDGKRVRTGQKTMDDYDIDVPNRPGKSELLAGMARGGQRHEK